MAEKRALFRVFLETLRDPNLTSEHKIKCLTLVVIPVLTTTLEDPHTNNSEVVTDALVSHAIRETMGECMDTTKAIRLRAGIQKLQRNVQHRLRREINVERTFRVFYSVRLIFVYIRCE